MKKILLMYAAIFSLMLCSCDDMLSNKEIGEVNDDEMWRVPDMVEGFLYQSYNDMPNRPDTFNGNFLDVATDNAVTNSFDAGIFRLAMGEITAANCPVSVWNLSYEEFQNINLVLKKGLTSTTKYDADASADAEIKKGLRGEALYLRAWWGAYLLQYHGGRSAEGDALGYPIVTDFISPQEASDYSWIKRNTYEECVSQICSDCDSAAMFLPAVATGQYVGRATSLMAEFVKARVLFLASSPAYQPSSIVRIDGAGDYTVIEESSYLDKWERAAVQIQKVIDLSGENSYVALKPEDLVDMDQNNPVTPSHFVFRYYYNANVMESRHYPPFYYGQALSQPSQNLVDAFPMKSNGFPIDNVLSGYDPRNPYEGRDARFEKTVYHQGSQFGLNQSYIDVTPGGKDSESFMSGGANASRTGYYLHKHLSAKSDLLNPLSSSKAPHFWPTMRMAEMFMDLAEASNEVWGPSEKGEGMKWSAYEIVKTVREKSGNIFDDQYIEAVKTSKDSFRELILNERRLEFAFENFRWWDLRRCLLPLDETVRGIIVTRDSSGALSYSSRNVESRNMNGLKYYYLPVPYNEMLKNPEGMVQNVGY